MSETHWQVRIVWDDGDLHEGGAWITLDEAETAEDAIRLCREWRAIPADAFIERIEVTRPMARRGSLMSETRERTYPPLEPGKAEPLQGPGCGRATCWTCPRWRCSVCRKRRPWCIGTSESQVCDICARRAGGR